MGMQARHGQRGVRCAGTDGAHAVAVPTRQTEDEERDVTRGASFYNNSFRPRAGLTG